MQVPDLRKLREGDEPDDAESHGHGSEGRRGKVAGIPAERRYESSHHGMGDEEV